jgi:hypothetical protein
LSYMLLDYLKEIPDHRRGQGRMFDLPHLLLFSILAIASGADSYRKIAIFIEENFTTLSQAYGIRWKRPPCYNSIRHTIHGLDYQETEKIFRRYSRAAVKFEAGKLTVVSLDGKALKHSFDHVGVVSTVARKPPLSVAIAIFGIVC